MRRCPTLLARMAAAANRCVLARLAFGNSDDDLEMLQWTAAGGGAARLMRIVHHTEALREYAYDRQSHVGRLDKALDEAKESRLTGRRHEAGLEGNLSVR
jgi:hypothetical protein